jgi:hypothetical protein
MTTSERVGGMCRTRPMSAPLGQHGPMGAREGSLRRREGGWHLFRQPTDQRSSLPVRGDRERPSRERGAVCQLFRQAAPFGGFSKAVKGEGKELSPLLKPR